MKRLLAELRRRKVYRVGVAYAVVGFVVIQVADLIFPALGIPAWAYSLVVVLTLLGFPIALVLAWAFELTPDGVRRTPTAGDATQPEAQATSKKPPSPGEHRSRSRLAMIALLGLGLISAAVAGGWYLMGGGGGESPEVTEGTVAVLPFQISGSGADTWRDGMVTMLNTGLDGAAGLRTIADRTVFAAWERRGRAQTGASTQEALSVAREVGAEYAVVGSAVQMGGELRFAAEIYESRSGERIGRADVKGPADSVTAVTDSLARGVLAFLVETGDQALPSVDVASVTTSSLPALKSFLAGERHFRQGDYEPAIAAYERAVRADTAFALAYQRLGQAHGWALNFEAQRQYWNRAYELSDQLPPREQGLVHAEHLRVEGRFRAAADTLQLLTDAYPDDPVLWYSLGEVLWHGDVPRGWPEADGAFGKAVELDPGNAIYHPHHAQLGIAVHYDSALAAERIAAIPNESWRETYRIPLDLAFGTPAARSGALSRLDTIPLSRLHGLGTWFSLTHPAARGAYEEMVRRVLQREGAEEMFPLLGAFLAVNSFLQGQVREGLSQLEEAQPSPALKGCLLAYTMSSGIPIPDSVAAASLAPSSVPDDAAPDWFRCSAIYLIERGRADEVDSLLVAIREAAEGGEGTAVDRRIQSSIAEVEGFRAWKAGALKKAAPRFSDGTPASSYEGIGGLWLGDIYREMGQRELAESWYMVAWRHPVAHEHLGQLYEEMDEPERATAAYRRFIAAWEDADEELQPRVEAARERLAAMAGGGTS